MDRRISAIMLVVKRPFVRLSTKKDTQAKRTA
jgi:hypothetical protein